MPSRPGARPWHRRRYHEPLQAAREEVVTASARHKDAVDAAQPTRDALARAVATRDRLDERVDIEHMRQRLDDFARQQRLGHEPPGLSR